MLSTIESLNVAKMLEVERKKKNMTFEDVGSGLGCSASYVFRIEKGKRKKPSYELVSKMIRFFMLSPEDVLKYSNQKPIIKKQESTYLEEEILKFIKKMDVNVVSEVNNLLSRIEMYQKDSKS